MSYTMESEINEVTKRCEWKKSNDYKVSVIAQFKAEIESLKKLNRCMGFVADVVAKSNNKVFNKRIATKVQTLVDNSELTSIFVSKIDDPFLPKGIRIYNNERTYNIPKEDWCAHYFSNDEKRVDIALNDNGTINTAETLAQMNKDFTYVANKIAEYEDAIANYDKYIDMELALQKAYKEYKWKCNYLLRIKPEDLY